MRSTLFLSAVVFAFVLRVSAQSEEEGDRTEKQIRLHIATWNVNEQDPPSDMEELLGLKDNPIPDVVVVGFQEITMNPSQAFINNLFDDKWTRAMEIEMSKWGYEKMSTKRMVGVLLNVFVLLDHADDVKDISTESVRTGFGGIYGNKGGVIVTMELYGSKMRFINSHLPAHDGKLQNRIEDYTWIVRNIRDTRNIDYSFWLGDLNFRLENNYLTPETIRRRILKDDYESLLPKDELKNAMAQGTAFGQYSEQAIHFRPTFKMFPGQDDYNMKRRPAWTDRILYMENAKLLPVKYTSLPSYRSSDHRPVVAQFLINMSV
uniref:Venom inositol phosphate phosphatase n=1 Tax=Lethocerus distinctifemur TaxID=280095 RepID=A0A2K8JNF6_9HEMI|nr:venom inositol phosphate phosphatase [Lethocerus distinctifemur]